MRRSHFFITLSPLLSIAALGSVQAQNLPVVRSELKDQTAVSLTVYSNGRSLIRDRRRIAFDKGTFNVELQDVSGLMMAETAQLQNLTSAADLTVHEQNLEYDLLSPRKLLEKYLGKSVMVVRTHPTTGADTAEKAEVLSVQDGVVLKLKDRIESGLPARITFPEVPANLRAQPTLSLIVESKKKAVQDVELNYLTEGISWRADYIADLNAEENRIKLTGLVTLVNESGTSFRDAQLQLMGGDVQTVAKAQRLRVRPQNENYAMAMADASASPVSSESLFEYHLYTLPRRTTILSNQTKQVTLLEAPEVVSRKEIVFTGDSNFLYRGDGDFYEDDAAASVDNAELGTPINGSVFIAFENDKKSRLGLPLPAGVMRIYKRDKGGASQFIGEDNLRHTPENERVRVKMGNAFDVTARRLQVAFKMLPPPARQKETARTIEFSHRVTFKNSKDKEQQVIYREYIPGEAKILSSSLQQVALGKGNFEWKVTVPAKGTAVLNYGARTILRR